MRGVVSARMNTSELRMRWLVVLAGIAAVAVVLVAIDPSALCLLPALALTVPLLMRRYPGERMIAALSGAGRRRWARLRSISPRPRTAVVLVVRGGLLLARSLAVRPPPALGLASN
jgi:hypothetical protein